MRKLLDLSVDLIASYFQREIQRKIAAKIKIFSHANNLIRTQCNWCIKRTITVSGGAGIFSEGVFRWIHTKILIKSEIFA